MWWIRLLPWAGWGVAALMFGLWLSARDKIIEERESCNADKLSQALEAQRQASDAQRVAFEQQIEDLASIAEREREAARIARKAQEAAEGRPERVKTVVREVASIEGCIDTQIPDDLLDSLRD